MRRCRTIQGLCLLAVMAISMAYAYAQAPTPYLCHRVTERMTIDGKFEEAAWKNAPSMNFYIPVTGTAPLSTTEGRVLWNEKYLFVGFTASDKDIWGYLKGHDAPTHMEDVLEVFLRTDAKAYPYYNFEINALGTVFDACHQAAVGGGDGWCRWTQWNCRGLRTAVGINGTLNNPTDTDQNWRMEIAIPFASIDTLQGKKPKIGDLWACQLARYDYSVYLPGGEEISASQPLSARSFHLPAEWSAMLFSE